jgi:hypothetical protein
MGITGTGDHLAKFIAGKAINPFVPKQLADMINTPEKFKTTAGSHNICVLIQEQCELCIL